MDDSIEDEEQVPTDLATISTPAVERSGMPALVAKHRIFSLEQTYYDF